MAYQEDENLNRRDFLRAMSAASFAAMASGAPRLAAGAAIAGGEAVVHPLPRADSCILLWMAGGMACPETFDPKRYVPFEKGLPMERVMSTFPAIDTVVDNIKISEGLETASPSDGSRHAHSFARAARSGQYFALAASIPLAHRLRAAADGCGTPFGAWMASVLGPRNPAIPAFIDMGQRLEDNGEKEELKAIHTSGFFGGEYGPFMLPYPEDAAAAVRPPKGMSPERFEARYRQYRELVLRSPLGEHGSSFQQESMIRFPPTYACAVGAAVPCEVSYQFS